MPHPSAPLTFSDPAALTVAGVAAYLHLHTLTVRRLLQDGTLPAQKVGRWIVERTEQSSASFAH